jgi:uncharacterized membrane protein
VSPGRLETFADGVFAIAATLLILEIRLPEGDIGQGLLEIWPSYVAYAISFVTIGIMWTNHHTVMRHLREVDLTYLYINILLLMCIAFVPFPTALVADHIKGEGAQEATLTYGLTLTVTAVCFFAFWHYARWRLLRPDADPREVSGITRSYRPGVPLYGGATLVALASPGAAIALFGAFALFYALSSAIWDDEQIR